MNSKPVTFIAFLLLSASLSVGNAQNAIEPAPEPSQEKPIDPNRYSLEWGMLSLYGGMPQTVGRFVLDGEKLPGKNSMRFYEVQANQKAFENGQTLFDQSNYYYFSHTNTLTGSSNYLGITHDKAQTSVSNRRYRYNKGGTEITYMHGDHFFSKRDKVLHAKFYAEYRYGLFLAFNDINALIETQSRDGLLLIESQKSGRAYAGMGLIAGGGAGLNWRITHAFSLSLGISVAVQGGYTREKVRVNGEPDHRLRFGYLASALTIPVIKFNF